MPFLLGGLFIGVLSALPVVQICNCCCLWILGGGVLAAYLEQQNRPASLSVPQGAKVGFLAGLVGTVVWFALDSALGPLQARFVGEVMRSAGDLPPELRDWLETVEAGRERGSATAFLLMLIPGTCVATIGGMIGAAYFRRDVPPALGGPMTPPPLP